MRRLASALLLLGMMASPGRAIDIRQGSTSTKIGFLLTATGGGPLTGATPSVAISKNGGAFAPPAGAVAEAGNGWYFLSPTAADTGTLGDLVVHATAPGALPADRAVAVVGYDPNLAVQPDTPGTTTLLGLIVPGLFSSSGVFSPSALANAPAGGGAASGVQVVQGTVTGSQSPTTFTATLSANAPGVPAAYVGRQVLFQSGAINQHRGSILSVLISGAPGSYTVTFTLNPLAVPSVQGQPQAGNTFVIL